MSLISDLFSLIVDCLGRLYSDQVTLFLYSLTGGVALGCVCWLSCSYFSRLWNLQYRVTLTHHVLCGGAALITILFTIVFVSLQYTKEAAQAAIITWQKQIQIDHVWAKKTFIKAYEEVKALGLEDFSLHPHPNQGGQLIPSSKEQTRTTVATVYADEAVRHFNKSYPFLGWILKAEAGLPAQKIKSEITQFPTVNPGGIYNLENAIKLAAQYIRHDLDQQVPGVVFLSRLFILILFGVVQSIPFGLIGFAAYKDLKVIQ